MVRRLNNIYRAFFLTSVLVFTLMNTLLSVILKNSLIGLLTSIINFAFLINLLAGEKEAGK